MKETGKKIKEMKKKCVAAVSGGIAMAGLFANPVCAVTTDDVIAPITTLKSLVVAIIGAVGVIILAKNVMEFAQAYQQQDSSSMNSALKGIVAGIIMAGISTVLALLGY